jgi:hypothetical protein
MRKPFQQPFRHHQAQHTVADEFQPFVRTSPASANGGTMGQSLRQQFSVRETMRQKRLGIFKTRHVMR